MLTFKEWISQLKTTERADIALFVSPDSKLLYDAIINEFTAVEKYADERPLSASGLWMYIRANWSRVCREAGRTPDDEYGRKAQVRFLDLDNRFADFNRALEAKGTTKKAEAPMQMSTWLGQANFAQVVAMIETLALAESAEIQAVIRAAALKAIWWDKTACSGEIVDMVRWTASYSRQLGYELTQTQKNSLHVALEHICNESPPESFKPDTMQRAQNFEQNFGKWCTWRYQIASAHAFDDAIKSAQWVHTQTNGHPVFTPIIEQAMRSAIVLVLPTDTWSMFAARWLSLCNDLWAVKGFPRNVPQLHADQLRAICSALYLQDLPLMEKQSTTTEKQANTNQGEVMSDTKSHVPSMSDLKSDASQAAYIVVAGKLTKLSAQSLGSLLQRELPNESPETRARIGAFLESSMGELVTSLMLSALVGPLGGTIADKLGVSSAQLDKLSSALRVHAMVSGGGELLDTLIEPAIVVLKDVLRALPSEDGPSNMHLLPEPAKRETLETVAVPDTAKVSK